MNSKPQPRRWRIKPIAPPEHLARFPHLPALVVQVLYNRGVRDPDEVEGFLSDEVYLGDPFKLAGMHEAVARLRQAIRQNERIVVYGDFDADGVTATALLVEVLRALGAQVRPYIPDRLDEGYGVHKDSLAYLRKQGAQVVVTVDCGIRSLAEIAYGRRLGLDIIVTDHHSVGPELPDAVAVVNPKRADCPYTYQDLAGSGIAFKLAQALLLAERQVAARPSAVVELLEEADLLDLVALGTVADMAPLKHENRSLVRRGLAALNAPQRPGIQALLEEARLQPGNVDAQSISFILGPRLNAAGRLDKAMHSYDLLVNRDEEKVRQLARRLSELNQRRQELTEQRVEQALALLALDDPRPSTGSRHGAESLYFVASPEFEPGLVGLVAGKLKELFYRPVVVVQQGPEESRGSARSIEEFDITAALDQCRDLLIHHGGHRQAAGFTVATEHLPALCSHLQQIARTQLADQDLAPALVIDAEVKLKDLTWATQGLLAQLEPCGAGNPSPLLVVRGAQVRHARPVGNNADHLKLVISDGYAVWDAIAFRQAAWLEHMTETVDLAFQLEVNEWNGQRRLQLNVQDLRPIP